MREYLYNDECRVITVKTVFWVLVRVVARARDVVAVEVACYVNDRHDQIAR